MSKQKEDIIYEYRISLQNAASYVEDLKNSIQRLTLASVGADITPYIEEGGDSLVDAIQDADMICLAIEDKLRAQFEEIV